MRAVILALPPGWPERELEVSDPPTKYLEIPRVVALPAAYCSSARPLPVAGPRVVHDTYRLVGIRAHSRPACGPGCHPVALYA